MGRSRLTGYPAFVGAPASGPARLTVAGADVTDSSLATVVQRALRNYLAASPTELAADLTHGAQVAVPSVRLALDSVQRLSWADADRRTVLALVQAQDVRGAQYTLAYELDVADTGGRWEIAAIQTDPHS